MNRPRGHSIDDYLEVIYGLASPVSEQGSRHAIAARVADVLGVSRAAVGEMLKRMAAEGLIERGPGRELILTAEGVARAESVVRRHRILERFLTDFLGYSAADAHDRADTLGSTFDDEMVERIHERLGFPERCPHGWPVQPSVERAENPTLLTLAELGRGDGCEIVRLPEHDGPLLQWLYDEGLTPGTAIEVRDVQAAAGHIEVRYAGDDRTIAEKAARSLLVRRDGA